MAGGRGAALVLGTATAAALLVSASASASVTIGSSLVAPANSGYSTAEASPQTAVMTSLAAGNVSPGGLTAPVNGTIVSWRIKAGLNIAPVALRVVRRNGNTFQGGGTGPVVTPAANTTTAFPASLPIRQGEMLGITCCDQENGGTYFSLTGGTFARFFSTLPDNGPFLSPLGSPDDQLLVNADIEPTATIKIDSLVPRPGGRAEVKVTVPNPGTLSVGDWRDAAFASVAAAKKKKPKLLKPASAQPAIPGQVTLTLAPTKAAKKKLLVKKRVKAKLKVVYTPSGGAAVSQAAALKLKR